MWNIQVSETRAFVAPNKYYQGPGEINRLYKIAQSYAAKTAYILLDPFFYDDYRPVFEKQFSENGIDLLCDRFGGICSEDEFARIEDLLRDRPVDIVFGMGGGMTADTAKMIGIKKSKPFVIVPTSIANDASTSGHSIVRRPDGSTFIVFHSKNPDAVCLDTEITIKAPMIMMSAGLGDAMATYYEACASNANTGKCFGSHGDFRSTLAGAAIAKLAHDTLLSYGRCAYQDAKNQRRSEAYENVVEANTLLSGLGFENTHCSIAHGLEESLHLLNLARRPMHGIGVGYSLLVQLLAEKRDRAEFEEIYSWAGDVGLPQCLGDLGFVKYDELTEWVDKVARNAIDTSRVISNEPFDVTFELLRGAMLELEDFTAGRRKA